MKADLTADVIKAQLRIFSIIGGEDLQGFQNLVGLANEALIIEKISNHVTLNSIIAYIGVDFPVGFIREIMNC